MRELGRKGVTGIQISNRTTVNQANRNLTLSCWHVGRDVSSLRAGSQEARVSPQLFEFEFAATLQVVPIGISASEWKITAFQLFWSSP